MAITNQTQARLAVALADPGAADEIVGLLGYGAGSTYYVDSTNSAASDSATRAGTRASEPFATLDYAIGRCTASKGDTIVLMPGHAETTTAIALDVAGVRILGLGYGRNRPTLTATTASTDLINVTAANCQMHNIRLVGAASGVTALVDGSAAATDFEMHHCELVLAATPLKAITWSGQRPVIEDLTVNQSANGADNIVAFEAGVDGFIFKRWDVMCPNGLDNSLIDSGDKSHEGYIIDDIVAVGLDTLVVNFASSTAGAPDGLFGRGRVMYSAAVTSIEDGVAAATTKGIAFLGPLYAADATGVRGGLIPLTSAS